MRTFGTRKVLERRQPALRGEKERANCYLKMSLAVTEPVAIKGQLFKLKQGKLLIAELYIGLDGIFIPGRIPLSA